MITFDEKASISFDKFTYGYVPLHGGPMFQATKISPYTGDTFTSTRPVDSSLSLIKQLVELHEQLTNQIEFNKPKAGANH